MSRQAVRATEQPLSPRELGRTLAAFEWSRVRHQLAEAQLVLEAVEQSPAFNEDELRELRHAYRCELHNLALAEDVARRRRGSR